MVMRGMTEERREEKQTTAGRRGTCAKDLRQKLSVLGMDGERKNGKATTNSKILKKKK